ncbi:MAG TPA: alpha/beta hydrolase [Bryobacteraceae bacterium]|nr:alpha/beta hydrolase [Bryobacteraceae bacterium]
MFLARGCAFFAASSFLTVMSTAAFGATLTGTQRNIEFARPEGTPLYLDASIPFGAGPFPAVIVVHGGAWVRGDRRTDVAPLFKPLEAADIAWFSIDYRLSNDILHFGAAIDDVRDAVRFVRGHASEYRIDPDRIALVGESAGGQLAAMAALDPTPDAQVRAVVALYTPTDLVQLAEESTFVPQQIRDSLRGTPLENLLLARLRQLSPVDNVKPDSPPFLLIHGTDDALVPFAQSRAMCDRMKAAGASCELFPVEGGGHGIRWWESARPREAQAYKNEMVRWLKRELAD